MAADAKNPYILYLLLTMACLMIGLFLGVLLLKKYQTSGKPLLRVGVVACFILALAAVAGSIVIAIFMFTK